MSHVKLVAASVATLAISGAGIATAHGAHQPTGTGHGHGRATTQITGGSTQVTLSSAASQALSNAKVTLAAVAPATQSGSTSATYNFPAQYTFPVSGGSIAKNGDAVVKHQGGLTLSNGTTTVSVSELTLRTQHKHAQLFGSVATPRSCTGHSSNSGSDSGNGTSSSSTTTSSSSSGGSCTERTHFVQLARIVKLSSSDGSLAGNVVLTGYTAHLLNTLAGSHFAKAGETIGTAVVTLTKS